MLYVITRTSQRPNFFKLNCQSLDQQQGVNLVHVVTCDDKASRVYINQEMDKAQTPTHIVEVERQTRTDNGHFPYNLYCNQAQAYIQALQASTPNGWIMYLDDDDSFTTPDAAATILKHCVNPNDLIIWKVQFPGHIAPPKRYFGRSVRPSGFSAIGFAYHSSLINKAQWDDRRGGDGRLIFKLSKVVKELGGKVVWIDEILTAINYDNGYGGLGRRIDCSAASFRHTN